MRKGKTASEREREKGDEEQGKKGRDGEASYGESGELEQSRVLGKLRSRVVGAGPGVEERRREREGERDERGLAAWVVQMGGTRHK